MRQLGELLLHMKRNFEILLLGNQHVREYLQDGGDNPLPTPP